MHRVHYVFQCILVVAVPGGGAKKVAIAFTVRQLLRKAQRLGRLVGGNAEPEENRAVRLLHVIAAHTLLPHQRTAIDCRHAFHFAAAADLHAVIPAGDAIAEVPAHRQARAAMRTTILQRLHLTILIAPHHNLFTEARDPDRRGLDFPARQHRIP